MATAGIISGTLLRLYDGGVAIGKATECTLSVNTTMRTTSHKDSASFEENAPGLIAWTMNTNTLYAMDETQGIDDALTDILAGTVITARFSTEVAGDSYYEGSAYIESVEISAPVNENSTASISLKGTGTLTAGTVT